MFTGIIEEIGVVTALERTSDAARLTVRAPLVSSDAAHGDSIAVGGVCLTVVDRDADSFTADVMAETLQVSSLGALRTGSRVNLERAAKVGDRLGGHIVQGHVDGIARVTQITPGKAWRVLRFTLPASIAPLVAYKGSIAIDGTSLTVSGVGENPEPWFEVSLIPETLSATTLGTLCPGDAANLETDILARHVERLLAFRGERERSEA